MDRLIHNGFVLGAGLGTRLRPLTAHLPKPLIPIHGKPLIQFAFDQLLDAGLTNLVVNTHHCAEAYAREFPGGAYRGAALRFRHEELLLETAGGIKNVEDLLGGEPLVVYNGDILSDLPVEAAIRRHFAAGNEVTLVLRSSGGPLQVAFDPPSGKVLGFGEGGQYLFTGVYVINPAFFLRIPPGAKISVIPIFREMILRGEKLGGVVLDQGGWRDLGTREQYLAVHTHPWIHPTARIGKGVALSGATSVGANAEIGDGAALRDCILWRGAKIASGSLLERCIVTTGKEARGEHADADF